MVRPGNKTLIFYLAAAVLALALLAFGSSLAQRIHGAREAWQAHVAQADAQEAALHALIRGLGYGGLIQHFKDYVLHQDPQLLAVLEADLAGVSAALVYFRRLTLGPEERQALRSLEQVRDEYTDKLELAQALVERGMSPTEIDRQVQVGPAPVLAAIAVLERYISGHLTISRGRMDAAVADMVHLVAYGGLLVLPLGWLAALVVRDRRRMRGANARLAQNNRYVHDLIDSMPDALLVIGEGGRIRQANLAAQRLLHYPGTRLVGMTVEDLMPARYRAGHVKLRERARAEAKARPMSPDSRLVALRGDGREVPVEISLSHSLQPDGLVSMATLRDVSEHLNLTDLLHERQEALQTAQAIAHIGSWDWRIASNELNWSDETYRIFGLEPRSCSASYETFLAYVHPEDRQRVDRAVRDTLDTDAPYVIEHRIVRPDGSERVVQQRAEVFRTEGGQPVRMIGTVLDITERKAIERELLFDQAIIQGLSQPIVVVDKARRIMDVNDAFCRMSGYLRDELVGDSLKLLRSGRHDAAFYRHMWASIESDGHWRGEIWNRRKDGQVVPQLLSITRICSPEVDACRLVGFYSDLTSIKENEARLERLAHFDQLTGLANRLLCHDRLRAAIARAHRSASQVAVMFVDLDGFKAVNDRFGHDAGDALLVQVAERMKQSVREDDTVARLGGDEFAVILNEMGDGDEMRRMAERVLAATRVHWGAGNQRVTISGSVGIACYPQDGEQEDSLLSRADQAMYRAKQAGKGCLAFYGDD